MLDATEVAAAELLLQNADFLDQHPGCRGHATPDDYSAIACTSGNGTSQMRTV